MFEKVNVKLKQFETSMQSFVIVMESKVEIFSVSEAEQQIKSSMDDKFQVHLDNDTFLQNTMISLQVGKCISNLLEYPASLVGL